MFISLTAKNAILLASNGKTIPRKKNLLSGENSVCFLRNKLNDLHFTMKIEKNDVIPKNFILICKDESGNQIFYGNKLINNKIQIKTTLNIFEKVYKHESNLLHWELYNAEGELLFSRQTRLSIYWVSLENEHKALYRKGIPVEVLEHTYTKSISANKVRFKGAETAALSVAQIIVGNFNYVPPRYDVWRGASYFGNYSNWNAITFHYTAFVYAHNNLPNSLLNCYDCAALSQYVLGVNGYSTWYCFMQPFGYMRRTNLIGRGDCNNPFYMSNGTTPVIGDTNSNRTAFGNHAFLSLKSNATILDSCAGPHTGTENINQYISNATDSTYPNPPRVPRGNSSNVGYYIGVTYVDLMSAVESLNFDFDETDNNIFNLQSLQSDESHTKKIQADWSKQASILGLDDNWKMNYAETVAGEDDSMKMMFFSNDENLLTVKIYASSTSNQHAFNRFADIALNTQSIDNGLTKIENTICHQALQCSNEEYQCIIAQYYNLVFHLHCSGLSVDLEARLAALAEYARAALAPAGKNDRIGPNYKLDYDAENEEYTLFFEKDCEVERLEFVDINKNLKILDYSNKALVFEKIEKIPCTLQIWSLDTHSLTSSKSEYISIE